MNVDGEEGVSMGCNRGIINFCNDDENLIIGKGGFMQVHLFSSTNTLRKLENWKWKPYMKVLQLSYIISLLLVAVCENPSESQNSVNTKETPYYDGSYSSDLGSVIISNSQVTGYYTFTSLSRCNAKKLDLSAEVNREGKFINLKVGGEDVSEKSYTIEIDKTIISGSIEKMANFWCYPYGSTQLKLEYRLGFAQIALIKD